MSNALSGCCLTFPYKPCEICPGLFYGQFTVYLSPSQSFSNHAHTSERNVIRFKGLSSSVASCLKLKVLSEVAFATGDLARINKKDLFK